MATPAMIEVRHVSKTFRRSNSVVEALRDFNLNIKKREILAVIGPSGCGKSTLLNIIAGLYAPSQGRIVYKGSLVTDVNTDVGYMTQKDNLLPWRNVHDNIAFPLELAGVVVPPSVENAGIFRQRLAVAAVQARPVIPESRDVMHVDLFRVGERGPFLRHAISPSEVIG